MENFLNQNISLSVLEFAFLIMIICLFLILISFFNNQKKIKLKLDDIQKSITNINSHINEISTEYGIIDKNLNSSKEDLTNINQTIRSIQKDIGKKSIIYCEKGSLEINDTWLNPDKIIKVVNGKRDIIKQKMIKNIYSYQIENVSKSIMQNKKKTLYPGFDIEDTLLNTEILEKWANA